MVLFWNKWGMLTLLFVYNVNQLDVWQNYLNPNISFVRCLIFLLYQITQVFVLTNHNGIIF